MSLIAELQRRNVIRMAGLYVVGAWLIVQVADTLLPVFDTPAWVMRALVTLMAIGFVPALVFTWVFELTPDGFKRDEAVAPEHSIGPQTAQRMNRTIIVLLLLALGYFAVDRFMLPQAQQAAEGATAKQAEAAEDDTPKTNPASIAVLPFADLSQAGDQAYFSDGMSEEILNVLTRVNGLQVASRTSAFAFKGQEELGIPAIARQLRVRHVLEGSVRRAGGTIRITAQLIDADSDRHLWSETFDRPLTAENVFAIQDEIAKAIVEALVATMPKASVGSVQRVATTSDLDAYDNFLRARDLTRSRRHLKLADDLLERSLQQDDQYAPAWELRAGVQNLLDDYGETTLSVDALEKRALEFAGRALALAPDSAMAIAVKANIRFSQAWTLRARPDLALVIADLEQSLALDPNNVDALNWYGLALSFVGRSDEALATFQRCVRLDPQASACSENEYDMLFVLGRYDETWQRYQSALDRGAVTVEYTNFEMLARFGQKVAFTYASNQSRYLPRWRRHEALYEAMRHPDEDHSELIRDALAFAKSEQIDVNNGYVSLLLHPLGAYDLSPNFLLIWDEYNHRYRKSPQFKHYAQASGLLDYWRKAGFPPQCEPIGTEDFRCD